jgi:aminoglycoside phosphotransferase (APT) family kinase protein
MRQRTLGSMDALLATAKQEAAAARSLDTRSVERYLRARTGNAAVVVDAVVPHNRGISRETWSIRLSHEGDLPANLILRRDPPGNSIDTRSLRFEYEVYHRLAKTDVPVAQALWYEEATAGTPGGRDFYLREEADGSWDVPHARDQDPQWDEWRIALSKEHIACLATLHRCDWRLLGFGEILETPAAAGSCAQAAIARHFRDIAQFQITPFPVFTEVREWLLDNAPAAPSICLLKGTNGLGEEVFRGGRIVAMSDWEMCSLGDPASDFARTQDFLPTIVRDGRQLWGLEQALDHYKQLSGTRITPEAVDYYRVLNTLDSVSTLHHGILPIVAGTNLDARLSWLGTEMVHRCLKLLADAAAGRSIIYSRAFFNELPAKA